MVEGNELKTSKEHGLDVMIAHGTTAWIQQNRDIKNQEITPLAKVQLRDPDHTIQILTILLANLIEPKKAG